MPARTCSNYGLRVALVCFAASAVIPVRAAGVVVLMLLEHRGTKKRRGLPTGRPCLQRHGVVSPRSRRPCRARKLRGMDASAQRVPAHNPCSTVARESSVDLPWLPLPAYPPRGCSASTTAKSPTRLRSLPICSDATLRRRPAFGRLWATEPTFSFPETCRSQHCSSDSSRSRPARTLHRHRHPRLQ